MSGDGRGGMKRGGEGWGRGRKGRDLSGLLETQSTATRHYASRSNGATLARIERTKNVIC